MKLVKSLSLFMPGIFLMGVPAFAELTASVGLETRYFNQEDTLTGSVFINPEYVWQSENGNHQFYTELFGRYDELDENRSNADVREALYTYSTNTWELSAGVGKVFWGVTESNHLVDVINQTDASESSDGEAKLGQPMLKFSTSQNWGLVNVFILPYFRERHFPHSDSPLSGGAEVSEDASYESSAEEEHVDVSLRYSQYFGDWDVGLYYFKGTNRQAKLTPVGFEGTVPVLSPFYDQMTQYGATVQATLGAWLWKLETIRRTDSLTTYEALSAGFEYTFFGINGSAADIGVLGEYNYDSRGEGEDDIVESALQNDIFLGGRLTLNDVQDTNFLLGVSQDVDNSDSYLAFIEANRRLGDSIRFVVDARLFASDTESDPVFLIETADYFSLSIEYFF